MVAADELSRVFAALADPTRREILSQLAEGPVTVGELAEPHPMSASAVSQHLKVLERAGLVEKARSAQWRTVSMRAEPLDDVAAWVARHRRHWNERLDALEERIREMKGKDHE